MSKPSLAETHPEISKQWHPTKNGELTPTDVTYGSSKKVWWKCEEEEDHEWESTVSNRSKGKGCPCCKGKKVVESNCLLTLEPTLSLEWHPSKNSNLSTQQVTPQSNKIVWWKCNKAEDHEWETQISNRFKGNGCPFCANKRVSKSNSLGVLNPKLAQEWHPVKNKNSTPFDVTPGSDKSVWWKCNVAEDHEWQAAVYNRSNGTGCPFCRGLKVGESNSFAKFHPKLSKEWHYQKNGNLTTEQVVPNSNKKVWWKCDVAEDHEWEARIADRSAGQNCPICSGNKVVKSNSLAMVNPKLAKEWHPSKNGKFTPFDFTINSGKKFWWKCEVADDHEWYVSIDHRSRGTNCPCCSNKKVVKSNCIATTNPELVKEWHPVKNGKLTAKDFTAGSHKKIWWKCDIGDDHEWKASIEDRIRGFGCTICSGKKVVKSNSLSVTHPEFAKEWHPLKNGKLIPSQVRYGSSKRVWWRCDKAEDHEWEIDNKQ